MSSINFEDVANFSNTSLFSISKEELQTQCQKNRQDLELLPKLNAAKAIVQGTPSSVIPPDMDLTKVQEILEIGQEELQFKTFAQQKDIYNTNILEKTNKIISDIHISQTNILSTTLEAIGTYVNVLNEFSNQVTHPIGPEKFTAAINEDAIINTKLIKYTEYMDKVVTFRNRMGYILSFMTPKALNSNVDIKTFVEGMPYANTITYEEGNEALFMPPITLNTNSK